MQLQTDYLAACRNLKLTRDSKGVLLAEFHSNDGPFTFLVKSIEVKSEPVAQKGKVA
jgi:hypothetical protein